MSQRSADALELLLPEAAPQFWQRAQRVTTFLRLLSDDARGRGGASVAISLARARGEFERSSLARTTQVHEELLRHHLYALVGADSFAHFGECSQDLQSAWSELEAERPDAPWVAQVPSPGESAASVAGRLLASLQIAGASAARVELWQARCARAVEGPAAGEGAFERCLARSAGAPGERADAALRGACLAGWIECALDRGAVRAARVRLEAEGPRALSDARLRRLAVWVRVLSGHEEAARQTQGAPPPARGRLPRPLAELRARVPSWAGWFSGVPATKEGLAPERDLELGPDPIAAAAGSRTSIGAALFTAWTLAGPGCAKLHAAAVAPAHRGRLNAWLEAREGACADPREPECQLLADAQSRVVHFAGTPPSGAETVAPSVLALAWVPLRDGRGDVFGWLRVELEHHLVPSSVRLERLGRAWAARLAPSAVTVSASVPAQVEDEGCIQAAVLRSFSDGLALKTSQRRWSAFDVREGSPLLVAQGGQGLECPEDSFGIGGSSAARGGGNQASTPMDALRGEGRAVARAVASGRTVQFSDADRQLSLHARAASGVAVPLRLRGRVAGVWLVESARRRDFTPADVLRFEARAQSLASELAAAQFCAWHRAHFGHDVFVSDTATSAGLGPEQIAALAQAPGPVALCGPLGSGRRMLARRLHFEGPRRSAPLRRLLAELSLLERALSPEAESATWIVERVADLPLAGQVQVAQWIEERTSGPARLCLLFDRPLAVAMQQGALAPELAWSLARGELQVAPLAMRRREIAPLARLFAAHFAAEQGARAPELDDTAMAFLWRQPWEGNVRELVQWMFRLVLCRTEGPIDGEFLAGLAVRFGLSHLRRVPSRHPDRAWLAAALECTATRKGSWNKTRAALYLGWDPDTLQSRLSEAGLGDESAAAAASLTPGEALTGESGGDAPSK